MISPGRLALAAVLPLLAALVLAGSAAADEMYRWVDAQGNEHFGSAPPPGAKRLQRVNPEKGRGSLVIAPKSTTAPSSAPTRAAPQYGLDSRGEPLRRGSEAAQDGELLPGPERYGGLDEEQWRSQARSRRRSVESAQRSLEQTEESERRSFSQSARSTNYDRIDRAKEALRDAEQRLNDFEQRAREAEVPQSWLD